MSLVTEFVMIWRANNFDLMFSCAYSLEEMLQEYERVVTGIPAVLLPMVKPFIKRVEEAMKPGLASLSWTSMNVRTCELANMAR